MHSCCLEYITPFCSFDKEERPSPLANPLLAAYLVCDRPPSQCTDLEEPPERSAGRRSTTPAPTRICGASLRMPGRALDYLDWLHWPRRVQCPLCAGERRWKLPDGRWSCDRCGRRVSATAARIFHGTRTRLTVRFQAAWPMTSQKHGCSSRSVARARDRLRAHHVSNAAPLPDRDGPSRPRPAEHDRRGRRDGHRRPAAGTPRTRRAGQHDDRNRRRTGRKGAWARG